LFTLQEADDDDGILDMLEQLHSEQSNVDETAIRLSKETVDRLYDELKELKIQMDTIANLLGTNRIEDAIRSIKHFVASTEAFYKYTQEQLDTIEERLQCCNIMV
jgi:uncharacterized protein (DUF885 family)